MSIEYPLNINGNELVKTWSLLKKSMLTCVNLRFDISPPLFGRGEKLVLMVESRMHRRE